MAVSENPQRPITASNVPQMQPPLQPNAPKARPESSKRSSKERERNLTRAQAHAASQLARADLVSTLNALEEQLNFPKRISRATRRASARVQRFVREEPVVAIGVGVAVVAMIAGTVVLIVRANSD